MKITLHTRTEETVRIYFNKANCPKIRKTLPQKSQNLEEALADYHKTIQPGATSYGRTIQADGTYIGDIWCYGIDSLEEPNAMVSYCIFDLEYWNCGAATNALQSFLEDIVPRFHLKSPGAFTYSSNLPSIRVLEKNGFRLVETFAEDGVESQYYQLDL